MRLCAFADEASAELSGQIAALKRNGITQLEIRGVNGKNIKDLSSEEVKAVKAALDEAGISVWSIGSPIGKISLKDDFEAHIEDFKRILSAADILGCSREGKIIGELSGINGFLLASACICSVTFIFMLTIFAKCSAAVGGGL